MSKVGWGFRGRRSWGSGHTFQPRVPAATLGTLLHPPAERVSIKMSGNKRNGRGSHTFRGRGVKKGERLKRNSETQERREGEGG